jgi:hypothetical protein
MSRDQSAAQGAWKRAHFPSQVLRLKVERCEKKRAQEKPHEIRTSTTFRAECFFIRNNSPLIFSARDSVCILQVGDAKRVSKFFFAHARKKSFAEVRSDQFCTNQCGLIRLPGRRLDAGDALRTSRRRLDE